MFSQRIGAVLLVVAVLGAFTGALSAGFVSLDDPSLILDNENVTGGLTIENAIWALTTTHAANWMPVTWLSHMMDVELFGLDPAGHHLVSILLHALNAALVLAALRGLGLTPLYG